MRLSHIKTHFIELCQLVLGEEVENADLSFRQVLGRQVQIGLYAQETAFADLLLNFFRRLLGMGVVKCGETAAAGCVGHIVVDLYTVTGIREHQCLAILAGEEQPALLSMGISRIPALLVTMDASSSLV